VRLLVEIFVIGALIYLGWEKPFKEWVDQMRGTSTVKQTAVAPQGIVAPPTSTPALIPVVRATPTPSGAWMWDPNHRGALDRPTPSPTGRP